MTTTEKTTNPTDALLSYTLEDKGSLPFEQLEPFNTGEGHLHYKRWEQRQQMAVTLIICILWVEAALVSVTVAVGLITLLHA